MWKYNFTPFPDELYHWGKNRDSKYSVGDLALDYAGKKISGAGTRVKNFFTNDDEKKAEQERKRQANELRVSLTKKQHDLKQCQKERDRLNDELIFTKSAPWSPAHAQARAVLRDVHAIESDIEANEKKIDDLLVEINDETARLHELQHGCTDNSNALYHWGVKGMTWGKHKYKKVVNGEYVYDDSAPSSKYSVGDLAKKYVGMKTAGAKTKVANTANKYNPANRVADLAVGTLAKGVGDSISTLATGKRSDIPNPALSRTQPKYSADDLVRSGIDKKISGAKANISNTVDRISEKVSPAIGRAGDWLNDSGKEIKKAATEAGNKLSSAAKEAGDKLSSTAKEAVSSVKYQFDPANKTRGTNKITNDIEDQQSRIDAEKASRTDHGPGGKGKVAGDIEASRARYYECHDRLQEIYGEMDKIEKTLKQYRANLETAREHGLPSGRLESEIDKLENSLSDLNNENEDLQNEAGRILSKDPELKRVVFGS